MSAAETVSKFVQVPFGASLTQGALVAALGGSFGGAVVFLALFLLFRPLCPEVYAPHLRTTPAPPRIPCGVFGWLRPAIRTSEAQLMEAAGVDAAVHIRCITMLQRLLLTLSILGCLVFTPLIIFRNMTTYPEISGVMRLTPFGVWGDFCWAYVYMSYIFDAAVCHFLWAACQAVRKMRTEYFNSVSYQSQLHSRTLMVTDVAEPFRTNEGVKGIVDEIEATGDRATGVIALDPRDLPKLIKERDKFIFELEVALVHMVVEHARRTRKGDRSYDPAPICENIRDLNFAITELEDEITDVRYTSEAPLSYGFVSFHSIEDARRVARAARKRRPRGSTIQLAPRPEAITWESLVYSRRERQKKSCAANAWFVLVTVLWIIPTGLNGVYVSDFDNIASHSRAFRNELDKHPKLWAAIQGIVSPTMTILLPTLLGLVVKRIAMSARLSSTTSLARRCIKQQHAAFIFNNFITFSVAAIIWRYIYGTGNQKDASASPWAYLTVSLCVSAPFWMSSLLVRVIGVGWDMAQLAKLTRMMMQLKLLHTTPRAKWEITQCEPFGHAADSIALIGYFTLALVFAPFMPLILPAATIAFTAELISKRYQLLYVWVTKNETGGGLWPLVFDRVLFAAFLNNFAIGVFVMAKGDSYIQIICMVPLSVLLLGFRWYCVRRFADEKIDVKDVSEEGIRQQVWQGPELVGRIFGHPALNAELEQVTGSDEAQELLDQLLSEWSRRRGINSSSSPSEEIV
ncbi:protein of unknown function DUF221 [Macrophomina phaseolina MS6]|uniref:CSC1/OSCA1-like 7TM region domain-containing protein n=1 Tax=Macrophomina phaseolina (strain MS6) TaxID=1126212 RepID=K2RQC5_MACPH|nr:protein of unknown function DUF221 [Macrophomina phaseolina MS6]